MTQETQAVFAILGALVIWTVTVIGAMNWLNKKFEDVKDFVRSEIKSHKEDDEKEFAALENQFHDVKKETGEIALRLVKIELFTDTRRVPTYPLGNGQ